MALTRAEILASGKNLVVPLNVPPIGEVHLLRWTGTQRAEWDAFVQNITNDNGTISKPAEMRATAVQMGVCNPDGTLMFKPQDVDELLKQPADWQEVVFVALCALNKLTKFDARMSAQDFFTRIQPS
jgi:hypothetical protein